MWQLKMSRMDTELETCVNLPEEIVGVKINRFHSIHSIHSIHNIHSIHSIHRQNSQNSQHSQHSQTCKRPSVIKSFEDLLEDEPPSTPSVRAARSFSESSTILAEILRRLFAALFAALFDRDFLRERSRVAAPVPLLFIGSDRV